jgi:uncharacterized membrane protein YedE/YeeE
MASTLDDATTTLPAGTTWRPSAALLTGGLLTLAVGYLIGQVGLYTYLGAGRGSWGSWRVLEGHAPALLLVVGVLIGLAGFAATLLGVYRLARNVDTATAGRR